METASRSTRSLTRSFVLRHGPAPQQCLGRVQRTDRIGPRQAHEHPKYRIESIAAAAASFPSSSDDDAPQLDVEDPRGTSLVLGL